MQKIFLGKDNSEQKISDLSLREKLVMGVLVALIVWLGLFPQRIITMAQPAVNKALSVTEKYEQISENETPKENMLTNQTLYDRN